MDPNRYERLSGEQINTSRGPQDSATLPIIATSIAAISAIIFGYSLGFTSPANPALEARYFGISCNADGTVQGQSDENFFGSMVNLGAILGGILAQFATAQYGRKGTIILCSVPYLLAYLWMSVVGSFTDATPSHAWMLLSARFLVGLAIGLASVATPMYIADVSPDRLRGALGAVFQFGVVIGIFIVNAVGAVLPHEKPPSYFTKCSSNVTVSCYCDPNSTSIGDNWVFLSWTGVGLSAALLLAMLPMPRSPRWLVLKGKDDEALQTIQKLRGPGYTHEQVKTELNDLTGTEEQSQEAGTYGDLLKPGVRFPLMLGIMMMVFQQFSGVNAVIFFGGPILADSAGSLGQDTANLLLQAVQIVFTGVSVMLMDKAGRKKLLTIAASGMCVCAILAGLGKAKNSGDETIVAWQTVTVISLMGFLAFFSIGLGAIPWLLVSEMFSSKNVSKASGICTVVNWLCSFIVTFLFNSLKDWSPAGTFYIFGGVCGVCVIFVQALLVETKGRSLEQICAHFMSSALPNDGDFRSV